MWEMDQKYTSQKIQISFQNRYGITQPIGTFEIKIV